MVKALRAVLAVGVMCGCYAARSAPTAEETVAGRLAWIDANQVPVEYRHLATSPLVGPYYILVSVSRHYCVVPDAVYVTVHDNERWACDWRPVRPAGIRVAPRAAADTLLPRIQD
jgi:hypothetical protein